MGHAAGKRRARYALLLVALAAMTLSPVATLLALPRPQPAAVVGEMPTRQLQAGALSIEVGESIVFPAAAPALRRHLRRRLPGPRPRASAICSMRPGNGSSRRSPRDWIGSSACGAWGSACSRLRPAIGIREIGRLRRDGVSPVADNVAALLSDLARRMGLTRPVAILESARVQVPVVVGHLRPLILLPVSLASQLPVAQLEAILAHELAHVRRHDYLVNLWQTLAETVLFYHPAVWWLSRRLRQERENCCDDLAVAVVENRVEYGRALLAVAQLQAHPTALALGVRGGSLPARIARLLPGQGGAHAIDSGNLVASGALLSVVLVLCVWATAVAHPPEADMPAAVKEMQKERLAILEQMCKVANNLFQNARVEYASVLAAQRELLAVRLDYAQTREERIKACDEAIQQAGHDQQCAEARRANARGTGLDVLKAQAYVLECQITRARAEAGK